MHLIEVAFKGNRKEFYSWEGESPPPVRASIVVEADRGEDLGVVHAVGDLASVRSGGCAHGCGTGAPDRKALRLASPRDVTQSQELRTQDEVARRKATERVKAHGLVMKLSDAEWQWDRKKLTFYFTAEKRVDFRNLVRDLAALFRARIELKQIGVRDEAKRLDGVGRCGRQYCSASWLPELRPVNLGVAKDQHLSLNPSQISGACGRLMCCLRYEHEFYVQSRKRFPKEGKTVVTARGEEKVVANDIFNERVTLRMVDGETRVVPLAELRRELEAVGSPLPGGPGAAAAPNGTVDDAAMSDDVADPSAAAFGTDDDPGALAVLEDEREESGMEIVVDVEDLPPEPQSAVTRQRLPDGSAQPSSDGDDGAGPLAEGVRDASAPHPGAQGSPPPGEVPHRRRGRRGGRRGRGKGGPPGGGGAPNSDGSAGEGGSAGGSPPAGPPSPGPS
jgi:cell fate regulator YaaT (PSP1 superfamily)